MNMKPPILCAVSLMLAGAALLPAADQALLNLVMPDARILAGINVDQAKATPFGQYVLTQIQAQGGQHLQQVATLTGFDPTRDLHELLIAVGLPGSKTGLILARGNFDAARIQTAAQAGGGTTVTYNGVTLLLDPKQKHAVAFLGSTIAVAGDVASVKAAVDRQSNPTTLNPVLEVQVNQWSTSEDAWAVAATPLSALKPPANASHPPNPAVQAAVQNIQQAAGGVKFGDPIVLTGQAQTDTDQNATALANVVKFVANVAQAQAQQNNPALAAILPSLMVMASGNLVNFSLDVPESQAEQAVKVRPHGAGPQSVHRAPRRVR